MGSRKSSSRRSSDSLLLKDRAGVYIVDGSFSCKSVPQVSVIVLGGHTNTRWCFDHNRLPSSEINMRFPWRAALLLLLHLAPSHQAEEEPEGENSLSCTLCMAGLGTAGGVAAISAAPLALTAAGFTGGGVAAGSVAAGMQATFIGGNIAAGSLFASLQSAGAAGFSAWMNAGFGAVGSGSAYA